MSTRYHRWLTLAFACLATLASSLASAEITYENGASRAAQGNRARLGTRPSSASQRRDWHHADEQRRDWHHDRRPEQRKTRPLEMVPRERQTRRYSDGEFRDGYRHGYDSGYGDGRRDNRGSRYPPSYPQGYSQGSYLPSPGYAYPAPGYGGSQQPGYGYDAPRYELRGNQNGVFITPSYPRNIDNNPTYRRRYPTDR